MDLTLGSVVELQGQGSWRGVRCTRRAPRGRGVVWVELGNGERNLWRPRQRKCSALVGLMGAFHITAPSRQPPSSPRTGLNALPTWEALLAPTRAEAQWARPGSSISGLGGQGAGSLLSDLIGVLWPLGRLEALSTPGCWVPDACVLWQEQTQTRGRQSAQGTAPNLPHRL